MLLARRLASPRSSVRVASSGECHQLSRRACALGVRTSTARHGTGLYRTKVRTASNDHSQRKAPFADQHADSPQAARRRHLRRRQVPVTGRAGLLAGGGVQLGDAEVGTLRSGVGLTPPTPRGQRLSRSPSVSRRLGSASTASLRLGGNEISAGLTSCRPSRTEDAGIALLGLPSPTSDLMPVRLGPQPASNQFAPAA